MASSMAKKVRDISTKGDGTCSNKRSRKNKCSSDKKLRTRTEDRAATKGPLYDGGGQGGIVTLVVDSGIWPNIVGIEKKE